MVAGFIAFVSQVLFVPPIGFAKAKMENITLIATFVFCLTIFTHLRFVFFVFMPLDTSFLFSSLLSYRSLPLSFSKKSLLDASEAVEKYVACDVFGKGTPALLLLSCV